MSKAFEKFVFVAGLVLTCGCQAVLGDFEVSEPPAQEPSSVLGTACEPGAYRCTNEVLETCGDDRQGFVVAETCESADECNLNVEGCRPCVPGERMCRNNVLEQCGDDLRWQVVETCEPAEVCSVTPDWSSGRCDAAVCPVAGAHVCEGAKLARCSEGRDRLELVELCETPELCDAAHADELARTGARGECRSAACESDAYRCEGATLEHCAIDRTAWEEEVTVCDSPALCNAGRGVCAACEPDEVECNGAELRRCTPSGWETLDTCGSVELCDRALGRCLDPECDEPGALRCGSGGIPALERCSSELTWEVAEVCPTVELCSTSAGRCLPPACAEDETRCRGDQLERCHRDLTRWELVATCGAGEFCDAKEGCREGVCTEGDVRCNGASLERCVSGHYEEIARCATSILCHADTASCEAPTCGVGQPLECDGTIIQRCRVGREDFDDVRTCSADTTCNDSPTLGTAECDACTPNAYRCSGDDLLRCSSDGRAEERVKSCSSASCAVTGSVPACG